MSDAIVPQWVRDEFAAHKARFGPGAFPDDAGELRLYLGFWADEFRRVGATAAEVRRASGELARLPKLDPARPEWRPDHLPALVGRIQATRKAETPPVTLPPADDPDDALIPAWLAWHALAADERSRRLASARRRYPGLDLPGLATLACVLEIAGVNVLTVFESALVPRRDRRAELAALRRVARLAPDVARLPGDPAPTPEPEAAP